MDFAIIVFVATADFVVDDTHGNTEEYVADPIPTIDDDLFSPVSVRNARAVDDRVRELAPVVRLAREDIVVMGRFRDVSAALSDWRTFSSTSRPWHDRSSVRPEILLTDDPPRHTEVRLVIANALSPKALRGRVRSRAGWRASCTDSKSA